MILVEPRRMLRRSQASAVTFLINIRVKVADQSAKEKYLVGAPRRYDIYFGNSEVKKKFRGSSYVPRPKFYSDVFYFSIIKSTFEVEIFVRRFIELEACDV